MQDPSIFVGEGLPVAFSSISFLFYFLPLFFIIYYLIPARAKNVVLLAGSLFFYAWGEPRWILLLLASILVTWLLGRAMRPEASAGRRRGLLILGLVLFGIIVLAVTTACGGGVMRDLVVGNIPPNMFRNPLYVSIAAIVAVIVFILCYLHKKMPKWAGPVYDRMLFWFDTLGLAAFTVDGIMVGIQCGYES